MTFGISPNSPLDYTGLQQTAVPCIMARRAPTPDDTNSANGGRYPLWIEWRVGSNPTTGQEGDFYKLVAFDQGSAVWVKLASSESGGILTLSDTTDTKVTPNADGNLQITAGVGLTVTSDPLNNKLDIALLNNSEAVSYVSPDTGADVEPDGTSTIAILGQSIANTYGVETFNIDANTLGIRLKSPFLGPFTFKNDTGGANQTLLVENTVDQAGSSALIATRVAGSSSSDAYYQAVIDGATSWSWGADNSDDDAWVLGDGATLGGAPLVMRADVTGIINFPSQSCSQAYISAPITNVTGDGTAYTVVFDTVTVDRQSNYNSATGVFTCPRAGNYLITADVTLGNLAAGNTQGTIQVLKNGSSIVVDEFNVGVIRSPSNTTTLQANSQLQCAANDTLSISVSASGTAKVVSAAAGDLQITLLS